MRNRHFIFLCMATCISALAGVAVADEKDPNKDPQIVKLLDKVPKLIESKQPGEAIEKCEIIIDRFAAHYGDSKQRIYCARTSAESLAYLLMSSAKADNGAHPNNRGSIVISSTWAEAQFMKAYALQDLGRMADAKVAMERALELAPLNAQYLCEMGTIYQREKNWAKAAEIFAAAEKHSVISPENAKAVELARARRGLAYTFVEQGKLDEAEKKYQQCLADDPGDTRASREIEFIRGLRAKQKADR
jgi:tetratricopeptide (TPR) repeat protein